MSKSTQAPNLKSVFAGAQAAGDLSPASAKVLALPDYGAQIQAGLGVSVDDVTASEVFLVSQLIDDSGSIRFVSGNTEAVREGHNAVLTALADSKQGDHILTHCRYLNGTVLYEVVPLAQATRMDSGNFDPNGGTPLYDQTLVMLGTVVAKTREFEDAGVTARSATLIVTDGNDAHSGGLVKSVKAVVEDMLRREKHIVAGMGISDGSTDFRQVFRDMGIPDQWILTPGNTPTELRKAFQVFSRSAVRASQSGASFSQTAVGGFGNP